MCFTPGTRIKTAHGLYPVQSLNEGDKILTRDNGVQPLREVRVRTLKLERAPYMYPIYIRENAFGHGVPLRDIMVSPDQQLLIHDRHGANEVLIAATHLREQDRIHSLPLNKVTYLELVFDTHELVHADGIWVESQQAIHPKLREPCFKQTTTLPITRRELKAPEAHQLVAQGAHAV